MHAMRVLVSLACLLLCSGRARGEEFWREDFARSNPRTGLPPGWSLGPEAHLPFLRTSADRALFGIAAPSLRLTLDPQTLNYRIQAPNIPVPELDADYTLEISLAVQQPDSPFQISIIALDSAGRWTRQQTILTLLGRDDQAMRRYRVPFHLSDTPGPGSCWILLGLPYLRAFRYGSVEIDDVALLSGGVEPLAAYVTPPSVVPGESFAVHVSSGRTEAKLSVFREGITRERVLGPLALTGLIAPPMPLDGWKNGARWPTARELAIPKDWSPGSYAVEVDNDDMIASASFVVRETTRRSDVLVLLPNHTEQAYNEWGGHSFYSAEASPVVALDRPLINKVELYGPPIHLLRWLSRNGVPFAVGNDDDLNDRRDYIERYPTVIVVGHSEYWTRAMRRNLERTVARGGALLIFGGNVCWWQTRIETEDGVRRLICYKYAAARDPYQSIDPSLVTTHWDEPPLNEPANLSLGLSWREGGMVNWDERWFCPCTYDWLRGYGGYGVSHADHWAFEGTGLRSGDSFGYEAAIVGPEVDGALLETRDGEPYVTGEGGTSTDFVVLGSSLAWNQYRADSTGVAVMGIEERDGGFVFHGGTIGWSYGLYGSAEVQTLTTNLLRRAAERSALAPLDLKLRVWPNPTEGELHILGGLPQTMGRAPLPRILCFDASGRKVDELSAKAEIAARFGARWSPHEKDLPAGTYWIEAGAERARVVYLPQR